MSEFTSRRLSEIARIVTGTTPKAAEPDSWGAAIDFITPTDQTEGLREARPYRRLSAEGARRLATRVIPARSTNLTCIGYSIGKVSMSMADAVTNQQINSLIAIEGRADPDYLYYMIKNWSGTLRGHAAGSVTPIVNKTALSRYEFRVPTLTRQRAIAAVLTALDDKIAANVRLAAAIDDFLAAQFASNLQEEHEIVRLETIAKVNASTVKPKIGGQIRYIDIAAVGVGMHDVPAPISWDDAPSRAQRKVSRGDTLWSTVRPNRRSHSLNLSDDPSLVGSTGLAVLTPTTVNPAYLYEVTRLPEFTSYLENVAEGSAYPAVRADRFQEAQVPLLVESARHAFEELAAPMREHVHNLGDENRTLAVIRDALLPQLMSGKLRVKDTENVLEGML